MEKEDDGMAKAFGVCLGGVLLLSMGASFLQWAGPIVARTLSQFEQHLGSIVAIVVAIVLLYAFVRIKVARIRSRGRGYSPASVQQPAFAFHPGRDRPSLIGSIGRYLSERRGGPVIYDGGRPLHVFQPQVEEIEEEEEDEPGEREHQYTTEEARRIYQAAVAEKRRAKRVARNKVGERG